MPAPSVPRHQLSPPGATTATDASFRIILLWYVISHCIFVNGVIVEFVVYPCFAIAALQPYNPTSLQSLQHSVPNKGTTTRDKNTETTVPLYPCSQQASFPAPHTYPSYPVTNYNQSTNILQPPSSNCNITTTIITEPSTTSMIDDTYPQDHPSGYHLQAGHVPRTIIGRNNTKVIPAVHITAHAADFTAPTNTSPEISANVRKM